MLPLDFAKYQSALSELHFGKCMYFQISLLLWELQVIKDLLCVRDIAEKSSNRLLLLLILKKKKSNFTWNQLCWSLFLIKLHAWGGATFLRKQLKILLDYFHKKFHRRYLAWF